MKSIHACAVSTAAVVAALVQAGPAHANEEGASAGEIIVTARRVEERLQDVPVSITVFNQEQLADRNISTVEDLVIYTPSLSSNSQFGGNNISFTMRGFVQEIGTSPTIGVYFADVVAPRGGLTTQTAGDSLPAGTLFDLQNVQIVKGPQGTLFGRNTTGGALLVVPQKPTSRLEGYAEVSVGNYDMRRIQAVVNLPISQNIRLRLGGDTQKRDGYIRNTGRNKAGGRVGPARWSDIDYLALRGSLEIDLTPDIENLTVATYNKNDSTGTMMSTYSTTPGHPFGPVSAGQLARRTDDGFYTGQTNLPELFLKEKVWQIINTSTFSVNDNLGVKNIFSYGEFTQDKITGLFGTAFDASDLNPLLPAGALMDFSAIFPIRGGHFANQSTLSNELRFYGDSADNRLTYQGGIYFERSNPIGTPINGSATFAHCTSVAPFECTNPIGRGTVSVVRTRNRTRSVGLYAQATYEIVDRLQLTGGIRYTWDRLNSSYSSTNYLFPVSPAPSASTGTACTVFTGTLPDCFKNTIAKFSAPTWLAGLDYKITDDLMLYAKYARGYRAGAINAALPDALTLAKPETVDSYEAGFKASFDGAVRGNLNVSAFYNDFTDQILRMNFQDDNGRSLASGVNAGKSRIYGAEVEASVSPLDGLRLDLSYAYLNARITAIDLPELPANSGLTPIGGFLPGDRLVFTPEHKFSINATYDLPIDESIGDVSIGATYTFIDDQLSNATLRQTSDGVVCSTPVAGCKVAGRSILPSYGLLNLNLNWNSIGGSPFDLALFATNVTKKQYITYSQVFARAVGFDARQVGQPRMYGLRLRYTFGE